MSPRKRARAGSLSLESDPAHHLAGPFLPQTPISSSPRSESPVSPTSSGWVARPVVPWLRWVVYPSSAFKLLLVPIVLYLNWELTAPYFASGLKNPFGSFFLISGRVPTSSPDDPRYQKTYYDLVFIAYNVVFFSFVRQLITINACKPIAKYFGLRKSAKIERFGEQGYALVYFGFFGAWGYRIMTQLPTNWYETKYFWIDYPHWDMKPELKAYYLMQMAYWFQQLLVMVLKLEKPRKDYNELIAHHIVTLWLVGWSYFMNMTYIGNAVYMSMDIPDAFLAFSKLLNYIQWERAKIISFAALFAAWSYFRHWLNFKILWSVWYEIPLMPGPDTGLVSESAKMWDASRGVYFVWWMNYQVFTPLLLLQFLNIFWWTLLFRIAYR
ncbi:hypothetical protein H0H93_000130 [Arthromyces matolae]|nr:hypothetical protein H0H93_000130 [Arthromyces matolae]